jgi:DnaJ-domain-containing protein 1
MAALELLVELQTIRDEHKQEFILMERVDKFLGHLHAQFGLKNENPLESLEDNELDEMSNALAGLQLLGRKDDRDVIDDFSKIDQSGASKNFFKFLDGLDNPHAPKEFSEKRNADELLQDIGATHAPSLAKAWRAQLEAAKGGDTTAMNKLKTNIDKMFNFYQRAYNQLKAHFGAGGAFDDVLMTKDA